MNKEQFLTNRKKGLGGSDIAGILGISPWCTPLDIYLEKTTEVVDEQDKDALIRGNRAENYVLDTYEYETGYKLIRDVPTIKDKEYDFLFANVDAKIKGENVIVEAKSTSDFINNWDDIPAYYKTQVAHYAYITNADRVYIPVLFSNWQYRCFIYERDLKFEKEIRTKAMWFWVNHVQKKIPPKPVTIEDTAKLYPQSNGKIMEADKFAIEAIRVLKDLKEDIKIKQDTYKQVSKTVQEYMKDNELLNYEDKQLASWKNQISSRFDLVKFKTDYPELYNQYQKELDSRVFRIR